MKKWVMLLSLILLFFAAEAQSERKHIRKGNKDFKKSQFGNAEVAYRKAINENPDSYAAAYNWADALYKQEKYKEAGVLFDSLSVTSTNLTKKQKAELFHNLGNSLLKSEDFQKSIKAYKNALRNNPVDQDTRYNLAYAQQKLRQQQQQQQQQNQQNKDDKKQDEQDKEGKDQENKDQKDDKNKDKEQGKDQKENKKDQKQGDEQQQQAGKMSKEDAERLLDALENDEKDVLKKVNKQKVKATKIRIEKDW